MKTVSKTSNRHCFNPRLRATLAVPAVLLGLAFAAAPARADDPIDLRPVATTAVTASTVYSGYPPWRVSDWSGMTGTFPDGLDDTSGSQWSSDGSQDPSLDWIAWDLGDTYTLSRVHVWNDNAYGDGIKTLDIQTSSDGSNWHSTPYTGLSWPQAPQANGYPGFDQVFSTPITTRYIRFANFVSNGGYGTSGSGYYYVALDEVVFYELAGTGARIVTFSACAGSLCTIDHAAKTIAAIVPFGTNVTALAPTYTLSSGATCDKVSGGPITYNFTTPQTYAVISGDHVTTNVYTVHVTVAPPPHADDPIDLRPVATAAVTASTAYSGNDPHYVSDWSGMTGTFPDGLDDTSGSQWSSDGSQDPSLDWIAWDLGDTYTLSRVHVWNDNAYGDGIKTLDIQTSSDGSNWHSTPYTGLSWPQAPQANGYPGFDQVFSTPIITRYIRFANFVSNGGYGTSGSGYYYVALDEVVFYELAGTGKDIKSFSVLGNAATISETNIIQFVPFGTDLKTITPTITAAALATISPASGVPVDFSAVNPQTYTVISGDHSRTNLYAVTVAMVKGLVVKTYIGVTGSTGNLDPISKLMALTPSATSIQVSNIDYHNGVWSVPGSPSGDNFSILWDGWFDVLAAGGWGDYTFGTSSDDGSVVYLDLNRDGNFTDPGDLIVSNSAVQPVTAAVGTVTLNRDSVRIVIGYFQAGGSYEMSAGWAPGTVTDFSSLNLINGTSGYFFSYDPYAPPQLPPSSFSMPLGVPTFTGVPTVSGHSYWLVYKDNLAGLGTWTQLGSGWLSDGSPHTFTDTTTPLPAARFYRLEKR